MAYNYDPLASTALRLLTKFGTTLTFRALGKAGDPVTGLGGFKGVTRELIGVKISDISKSFPDTLVKSGDLAFLLEGAAVELTDRWVNGAAQWSVVDVQPISPNDVDIVAVKILVRA